MLEDQFLKWNSKALQDSSSGQTRSLKASHLLHSSLNSRLKRSDSGSSGERTFRKSREELYLQVKREDFYKQITQWAERKKKRKAERKAEMKKFANSLSA